jgi:phenol 2-monooxygenase
MIKKSDVIIVGSGSAGLCTATWLARQGIACTILEKRSGPLTIGQADGVQCRTVEVFESFGISEELLREAYHVLEVVFWSADEKTGELRRTGRTADTMPGLSHQPHVILNQGRINALLLDAMMRFNGQTVQYGVEVKEVKICKEEDEDYPVKVIAERQGLEEVYRAKYVLVRAVALIKETENNNTLKDKIN